MRLVSCKFRLAVELAINHDVDVVAELIGLSVARHLEPARVRDCGKRRQAVDYFVDIAFVFRSE